MQMVGGGSRGGEEPHRCQQGGELRPEGNALGQHLEGVVRAQLLGLPRPANAPASFSSATPPNSCASTMGRILGRASSNDPGCKSCTEADPLKRARSS